MECNFFKLSSSYVELAQCNSISNQDLHMELTSPFRTCTQLLVFAFFDLQTKVASLSRTSPVVQSVPD